MSYEAKMDWADGDVLNAEAMNRIESGINNLDINMTNINNIIENINTHLNYIQIEKNTDVNTLTESGIYYSPDRQTSLTLENIPDDCVSQGFILQVFSYANNARIQMAFEGWPGHHGDIYTRQGIDSVWLDWKEYATQERVESRFTTVNNRINTINNTVNSLNERTQNISTMEQNITNLNETVQNHIPTIQQNITNLNEKTQNILTTEQDVINLNTKFKDIPVITITNQYNSGILTSSTNDLTYEIFTINNKCVLVKNIDIKTNDGRTYTYINYYYCYLNYTISGKRLRYTLSYLAKIDDNYCIRYFSGFNSDISTINHNYSLELSDSYQLIPQVSQTTNIVDLNYLTAVGTYIYTNDKISTLNNCPTDRAFTIEVISFEDSATITQIIKLYNGMAIYMRGSSDNGSTWTDWRELCGILATKIITQPQNKTVLKGNSPTFSVEAEGVGLTYQWQVSSSTYGNYTFTDIEGAQAATLTLSNVQYSDALYYRCIITNINGMTITSKEAKLSVQNLY